MENKERIKQLKTYLRLIEYISEDGEMEFFHKNKKACEMMGDIYSIAHIAIGGCKNHHTDWVEKWDKVIRELKKHKEL